MPFPPLNMTLSGHHRPYRRGIPPHSLGFRPEAGYTKCGSGGRPGPPCKSLSTFPTCGKGGSYEDEVRTTTSADLTPTLPKLGRGKPLPALAQCGQNHAPSGHVTDAPCSPIPGCRSAHLARRRGSQEDVASIKSEGAVGGTNVPKTVTGRQVGGDARARLHPEVTAGRLGGALVAGL